MENRDKNTVSLWGRLGVQIDMTPEEFEVLRQNDRTARELLIDLIKSDRCHLYGESYFPPEPNEEYITDEDEFEFDIDFQPIQKEQPYKDALDTFIESEVPFRLSEILDVDASEDMVSMLTDELKANSDVMFDYDKLDRFLLDKYEKALGLDQNLILALQGEISVLRDEIDNMEILGFSDEAILAKEKRLAVLERKLLAEKAGVHLYLEPDDIIDDKHLDCFWYGGQIGTFEYKGYTVSIEVHGDVSVTLLDSSFQENLLHYNNRDNSGAYKNTEALELICDDETLHKLIDDGRLVFSNNNWVEYLVFDPDDQMVDNVAWDNILDNNVLDVFDDPEWVKNVVNEVIAFEEKNGLDAVIEACEEVCNVAKNSVQNLFKTEPGRAEK